MTNSKITSDMIPGSACHAHAKHLSRAVLRAFDDLIAAVQAAQPDPLDYLLSGGFRAASDAHEERLALLIGLRIEESERGV